VESAVKGIGFSFCRKGISGSYRGIEKTGLICLGLKDATEKELENQKPEKSARQIQEGSINSSDLTAQGLALSTESASGAMKGGGKYLEQCAEGGGFFISLETAYVPYHD